jgi:hypothetical protein
VGRISRERVADFLDTPTGRVLLCFLIVGAMLSPVLIFGRHWLTFFAGAIIGFYLGYQFAWKIWTRNGHVPKYDDLG